MALVALAMVGIIAMAGLSIDIGTLYQASAEAQRAADTAALAAARTISMQGLTGDPANSSGVWSQICGGLSSLATVAATAVVGQNPLSGASTNPTVTVSYSYSTGTPSTDCSSLASTGFAVNPQVTVVVQQANLPTYFSRIWGRTGNTVGATATAEVFNPSNSATYAGSMVPVQPRCVKPWIVPNYDPLHATNCTGASCLNFVNPATGSIITAGINSQNGGVVGERFWLIADCTNNTTAPCVLSGQPYPNTSGGNSLQYVPGQSSFSSTAVPSDGSTACANVASAGYYAQAIAGCDQSTQYQCGKTGQNIVDVSENPGISDTTNGVQCLIHQANAASGTGTSVVSGQDFIAPGGPGTPSIYPFQFDAGSSNPLLNVSPNAVPNGGAVTSSTSIVSLPIYDSSQNLNLSSNTNVTIIGFLQVFINAANTTGGVDVTVLNVSGCSNAAPGTPLYGTSPVPIRLITPAAPSS